MLFRSLFLRLTLAGLPFLAAQTVLADDEPSSTTPAPFEGPLVVKFFTHLDPNIDEFVAGKNKVAAVVDQINAEYTQFTTQIAEIGITPAVMTGGDIVFEDGKLYVYKDASDELIAGGLLNFVWLATADGKVSFFPHLDATKADVLAGKTRVETILQKFAQHQLSLRLDHLRIGITPSPMRGGEAVEQDEKLYLSITISDDDLERTLMRYISK